MNYVESFNLLGLEAKQIPCIKGENAPTTSTEGAVGCLYMNTLTGDIYKCTAASDGTYTWSIIGNNITKLSELENDIGYLTEHQDLSDYALKIDIPNTSNLASKATTLSGYGITDAYTKTETNKVILDKVAEITGAGDATAVQANLMAYQESNDARVDKIEVDVSLHEDKFDNLAVAIGEVHYDEKDITNEIGIVDGYRYSKGSGSLASAPKTQSSNKIDVRAGETYLVSGRYGNYVVLVAAFNEDSYLQDKSVWSDSGYAIVSDYEYVVPEGVTKIGFSTETSYGQLKVIKKNVTEFLPIRADLEAYQISNDAQVNQLESDNEIFKSEFADLENAIGKKTYDKLLDRETDLKITSGVRYNRGTLNEDGTYKSGGGGKSTNVANIEGSDEKISVKEGEIYLIEGKCYGQVVLVAAYNGDEYLANKSIWVADGQDAMVATGDYRIEYTVESDVTHIAFSSLTSISKDLADRPDFDGKLKVTKMNVTEFIPVQDTIDKSLEPFSGTNEAVAEVQEDMESLYNETSENAEYLAYISERKDNKTSKIAYDSTNEQYPSAKIIYDLFNNVNTSGGLNATAIDLLIQILSAVTTDSNTLNKIEDLKAALNSGDESVATLRLPSNLPADIYTLKYENAEGSTDDYVDICSFTTTTQGEMPVYDKFVAENHIPENVVIVGVYNSSNTRVGDIVLGSLGQTKDFGEYQYSFAAFSDIHIGDQNQTISKDKGGLLGNYAERFSDVLDDFMSEDSEVSFVVVCGDMVDNANNIEELETYHNIVKDASMPILTTMGNHEMTQILAENKNRPDNPWSYETIRPYFEQTLDSSFGIDRNLHYCFTPEGSNDVFIMFGISGLYSQSKSLSSDDIQWLHNILEENRNKRCFLFHHYFPWEGSGNAVGSYNQNGLQGNGGDAFYSLLKHYNNVIYFHGHSHARFNVQEFHPMNTIDNIFGRYSINIPSLTNPADENHSEKNTEGEGYIIDVYENGIVLKGKDFVNNRYSPLGHYCLNTTIQDIEENSYYDEYGMTSKALKSDGNWYEGCAVDKSTITKISFVDNYKDAYDESWRPTVGEGDEVVIYRNGTELFIDGKGNRIKANISSIGMFAGFSALTEIKGLWRLDMSNVCDIESMFDGCNSLKSLFLQEFNTAIPNNMKNVFKGCSSLTSIDISDFNLKNVYYFQSMCYGCSSLEKIKFPNVVYGNNINGIYLDNTFANCTSLTNIDMTRFAGRVRYVGTFMGCSSLKNVKFGETTVLVMANIFMDCTSIETIDISNFDVSNVDMMTQCFRNCTSLKDVIFPEVFDTSKVTNMTHCFSNCPQTNRIDCSGWDTTSLTTMDNFNTGSPNVIPPVKSGLEP
jgi:surface protein